MADTVSVTQADAHAAQNAWNANTDEYNQWHTLSLEEQVSWQLAFARHRIASTQPAPAFPARKALEQVVHRAIVAWDQSRPLKVDVADAIAALLQGKQP